MAVQPVKIGDVRNVKGRTDERTVELPTWSVGNKDSVSEESGAALPSNRL